MAKTDLRNSARWLGWRGMAMVLILVQACGQGSTQEFLGPNPGTTLVRLSVAPRSARLVLGDSVGLIAYGHFRNGDSASVPATWSARTGAVTDAGGYRAVQEGTDTIRAVSKAQPSLSDAAALEVVHPLDLAVVRVTPQVDTLPVGRTTPFAARAILPDGSEIVPDVTWSATGGAISPAGLFSALGQPGTYQVTAQIKGRAPSGAASVTVLPASLDVLVLNPSSVALAAGETQQFSVAAAWSDGSTTPPPLTWSATGGSVSATGLYTAGQVAGTFSVIVATAAGDRADTSGVTVSVPPPTLTRVILTPAAVTLAPGVTRQFTVTGAWSDGSAAVPAVTYSATGGTITPGGLYTAGGSAGSFQVIATQQGGTKADTSLVTISASAATLLQLVLTPASLTLAPGAIVQFEVTGSWSDGSTSVPAVTYSATGGTVSAGGLYTAGAAPGSYRLIATHQGSTKADTAAVTVSTPPTLTQLVLNPTSLTLVPGATQQFTVAGSWSDGSTAVPAVTYSATGGTITAGALYTAGATAGTYRVIATQQGRTKADTSAVTVSVPQAPIQWLWETGFETDNPFSTSYTHVGGSAMRTTEMAHTGSYALKLTTPPRIYRRASVAKSFSYTEKIHGVDLWFYLPAGQPDLALEVSIEGWSGTEQHLSSFEWKKDTQYGLLGWSRWVNGAWVYLPAGAGVPLSEGQWHHLRVEVDIAHRGYRALVIDGREFDLKGLPYDVTAHTAASSLVVSILLWSETAQSASAFVDDVRVGEVEKSP